MSTLIDVDIPKEIQQENKIFLNLTFRQLICVAVGVVLAFIVGAVLHFNIDTAIVPMGIAGLSCMAFGWIKRDGLPLEKVIAKRVRAFIYHNGKRPYRTKNAYVSMMNDEYKRRRAIDMSDKKIAKKIKQEEKKKIKEVKHSSLKAID